MQGSLTRACPHVPSYALMWPSLYSMAGGEWRWGRRRGGGKEEGRGWWGGGEVG